MQRKTALTLKPGDTVTWTMPPRGPVHEIEFIMEGVVKFVTNRGGIRVHKIKTKVFPEGTVPRVNNTDEAWIPYHHVTSYRRSKQRRADYRARYVNRQQEED